MPQTTVPATSVQPSNVHVLAKTPPRTPAERAFADTFARIEQSLPGSGWVSKIRASAMQAFEASGLPTRRVEAYKYTDLRERLKVAHPPAASPSTSNTARTTPDAIARALGPLAAIDATRIVILDGRYAPELSDAAALASSAEFMPLGSLLAKAPDWLQGKFAPGRLGDETALSRLNIAFMTDGILLKIKPGQQAPRPVLLIEARASSQAQSTTTRNIISVEAGASLTLIETSIVLDGAESNGLSNTFTDITIADGGDFSHVAALTANGASHMSRWSAKVGADATYRAFQLTAGPNLVRNELNIEMAGERSHLDISGAFLGRGTSHVDTTLVVDHTVPNCASRELFKGVLDDRARGVFQGKIIVRPGADKTDGKQMARALMLSQDAEFDSKPELEIYADDVACGHGATAAALDENLLFYCRSRGISEVDARGLLIEAFIGDAIDKIAHETIREAFMTVARDWLSAGQTAGKASE